MLNRGYSLQGNHRQEGQDLCIDQDTCHPGVIIIWSPYLCPATASMRGFPLQRVPSIAVRQLSPSEDCAMPFLLLLVPYRYLPRSIALDKERAERHHTSKACTIAVLGKVKGASYRMNRYTSENHTWQCKGINALPHKRAATDSTGTF